MAGGLRRGAGQNDGAVLRHSELGEICLAIHDGQVAAVGPQAEVMARLGAVGIDPTAMDMLEAPGQTITPGLIDAHTHTLFAGSRAAELGQRQRGAGYLEILAGGGGILATVDATRRATGPELLAHGQRWLAEMLRHGATTVEIKSGYGLEIDAELRLLEACRILEREGPTEVVPTFLGAHAVPREFRGSGAGGAGDYIRAVIEEQLPRVAEQGVARFCDVFCEPGVFDLDQSRAVLKAGRAMGLEPRVHADELHDGGGAALAVELGAASADHLAAVSPEGVQALGRAADAGHAVVATLLPATTFYLMGDRYAPARALIERGVPVALGSDFNPGTSPTANLSLVISIACIQLRMSPTEALSAVTINAAHALRLGHSHGSLEEGRIGDLVAWDVPRHELIPYWMGAQLVQSVVKRGRVAFRDDASG